MVRCSRCNKELPEDKSYVYGDRVYCEDCLMDIGLTIKECDPWASYVDTAARKRHGERGADGLTETEALVYHLIKNRGRATRQEVMSDLKLTDAELQAQLVALMHSELVKEAGEGGQQYLVPIG
jgi:hypothetical protein